MVRISSPSSSHCPHLSSDVAKDFSFGSSMLLSTLRSPSALVSGPPTSTPVALPFSLFSSAVSSSGGVSSGLPWGSVAAPVSSAGFLSSFPSGPPPLLAQSLSSSSLLPPLLSCAGGPLGLAAVADPVPSADSSDKDLPTSLPTSTSAPSSSAMDVSAHRSCIRCAQTMSSIEYDRHSVCLHCRDVQCSLEVRCSECSSWSLNIMQDYLKHRKTLVSKSKKKPVSATPSSIIAAVSTTLL